MTKLEATCASCGTQVRAPLEMAGRTGKCPKCGERVTLPEVTASHAAEPVDEPVRAPTEVTDEPTPGTDVEPPSSLASFPLAIAAAAGAAIAGAAIWALIVRFTGYEVGYVAWGIGAIVGGAAVGFGARGAPMGVLCAVLTLASILGGKLLGTHFLIQKELDGMKTSYTQELYDNTRARAAALAKFEPPATDEQLREFMVLHEYVETTAAEEVDSEELAWFKENQVPYLRSFHSSPPAFDAWRDQLHREFVTAVSAEISLVSSVIEDLNAIDLIFALLGISTAYGLVLRRIQGGGVPARAAAGRGRGRRPRRR